MGIHDRAETFKKLHVTGSPLITYDAWNAGSAKAIADAGAKAIATSSLAVAHAMGFDDGGRIPRELVEEIAGGIVETVEVPVTIDFESGYSDDDDQLVKNVSRLMHLGVVGIDLKDRTSSRRRLFSAERQAARIAAVRRAADKNDLDLFINARTEIFLEGDGDPTESTTEAIRRGRLYANAGASGFFVPGLHREASIASICEEVRLPINVSRGTAAISADTLAHLGVARISHGNAPYVHSMEAVRRHAKGILSDQVAREFRSAGTANVTRRAARRDMSLPAIGA